MARTRTNLRIFTSIRTVSYEADPIVKMFKTALDTLDNAPGTTKIQAVELVNVTMKAIMEKFNNSPPYEIYIPIFNRIYSSTLLNKHKYSRLDAGLGIDKPKTLRMLLRKVREQAARCMRGMMCNTESEGVTEEKYLDLYQAIDDARRLPLFNLHLSNLHRFFRPKITDTIMEWNNKYDRVKRHEENGGQITPLPHISEIDYPILAI